MKQPSKAHVVYDRTRSVAKTSDYKVTRVTKKGASSQFDVCSIGTAHECAFHLKGRFVWRQPCQRDRPKGFTRVLLRAVGQSADKTHLFRSINSVGISKKRPDTTPTIRLTLSVTPIE